jgi:hypothetical protein
MFDFEIARVRSIPMAFQRRPHCLIIHLNLPALAKRGSGVPEPVVDQGDDTVRRRPRQP